MKKFDHPILKVFLYGLPVILAMAIIASFIEPSLANDGSGSFLETYNGFSGLIFGTWMVLSLYLSARLLFSKEFRSAVLPRLSFFRERDERELLITARATRNSFLTTFALLIFLLCLSVFQMAVFRTPPEQAQNGKTGMITLGLNFSLLNTDPPERPVSAIDYVRYEGLPISNSAILFLLMLWQLGSYNYFMRKLSQDGADLLA